jgi:hypothetical protein
MLDDADAGAQNRVSNRASQCGAARIGGHHQDARFLLGGPVRHTRCLQIDPLAEGLPLSATWKWVADQGKPIQAILTPTQMQLLSQVVVNTLTNKGVNGTIWSVPGARWW